MFNFSEWSANKQRKMMKSFIDARRKDRPHPSFPFLGFTSVAIPLAFARNGRAAAYRVLANALPHHYEFVNGTPYALNTFNIHCCIYIYFKLLL